VSEPDALRLVFYRLPVHDGRPELLDNAPMDSVALEKKGKKKGS
jgi:hypothetical protein